MAVALPVALSVIYNVSFYRFKVRGKLLLELVRYINQHFQHARTQAHFNSAAIRARNLHASLCGAGRAAGVHLVELRLRASVPR